MLNIRNVILSVALVAILMVAVPLVTAGTEVVSNHSRGPASVLDIQEAYASRNKSPIPSYRSPLDECYDVPLREVASCRNASQVPIPSYRSPLDVCYDVPLSAAVACRLTEHADTP
jgi:hypothetical protein